MGKTQPTAETCDNCGRVIGKLETPHLLHGEHVVCADCYQRLHPQPPVQTIEATAKLWKAVQAIGVLGILVGVVMLVIGIRNQGDAAMTGLGALFIVPGCIGYIVGRVCAWWFHG